MENSSPNPPQGSITIFFNQLQQGDTQAATQLWERFFPRLVSLARKTLNGRPQRVADADDAAQSAFASFCLRVKAGEFSIQDRDDLWNLLGIITARKARRHIRLEQAEKRGGGKVLGEDKLQNDETEWKIDELAYAHTTGDFDLHCEELLAKLEPELREFAVLKLLGYRNREIAELHDCTERKVERKLQLIRMKWEDEWQE